MDLNPRTKSRLKACISSMRSIVYHPQLVAVYHQNEVLYITEAKALYIIIAEEDAACG